MQFFFNNWEWNIEIMSGWWSTGWLKEAVTQNLNLHQCWHLFYEFLIPAFNFLSFWFVHSDFFRWLLSTKILIVKYNFCVWAELDCDVGMRIKSCSWVNLLHVTTCELNPPCNFSSISNQHFPVSLVKQFFLKNSSRYF